MITSIRVRRMKLSGILERFKLTKNQKLTLSNVYWAVFGKSVDVFIGLLVGILVARYLGPEQYGLMSYVVSYVTLFSIISAFGLDNIVIRELSKKSIPKEKILGTALTIRLVLSLITIGLILVTLWLYESDSFTFWAVIIYSASLFVQAFNVIRNYFVSAMQNKDIVKAEIFRKIIGAGIKLILLANKMSLIWFIIAITFDFILLASGYVVLYWKNAGNLTIWRFDYAVARMLLNESFPLLLSMAAIIVYQKIDQVMIRNMIDNEAVGQFSVASGLTEYVIFIPTIIARTIVPLLVQLRERDAAAFDRKKQQFIDLVVWCSMAMAVFISASAFFVIPFLYGPQYVDAVPVLQIMAWKAVFVALFVSSGQIIIIEGIQKYAIFRNVAGCLMSVVLNLILIPPFGIIGSAWATLATLCVAGYLSNLIVPPYRYLFGLQTASILSGWRRILKAGYVRIHAT